MENRNTPALTLGLVLVLAVASSWLTSVRVSSGSRTEQAADSKRTRLQNLKLAKLAPHFAFEPNRGQAPENVRFIGRNQDYAVLLSATEAEFQFSASGKATSASSIRMKLAGADAQALAEGQEKLPGIRNYFTSSDAKHWTTHVPPFRRVAFRQVYPGVDLIFHHDAGELEFDFSIEPGANPKNVLPNSPEPTNLS